MSVVFSDLHARHVSLLHQMRAARDRERFVADAQILLRDLRLAGRSTGDSDERQRLEVYADYWGNFIAETKGEYPDTALESEAIASTHRTEVGRLTLIYESGRKRIIPFLVPELATESLVSREELLQRLKQQILTGDLALYGPPGIGKTVLAVELAHDKEVLDRFSDGVLWANDGRSDTVGTLKAWAAALGIPESRFAAMSSLEDRQRALRAEIGLRRMLLIVDDAREEASALKLGGPRCAHLCTTRSLTAAIVFTPEGWIEVNEMETTERLALLGKLVPEAVESDPEAVRELVTRTGGVPLTIALTGKHLRTAFHRGEPERAVRELVARWKEAPPSRDQSALIAATPPSLLLAIDILEEALDEDSRRMFRALSVFPPKPESFSREAALAVSAAPPAALESLVARGLLENAGEDRYSVYQPIRDSVREKLADPAIHERFVDFFVSYAEAHQEDYSALDLEMPNIRAALERASERGMLSHLVQGTNAIYRFLEVRGLYHDAWTYLARAQKAAESLEDISGLMTTLLNEGKLAEKGGDYVRAREYLDRGLEHARQTGDRMKTAELLLAKGIVEISSSDLVSARKHLEEALHLHLEQIDVDPRCVGEIYSRLGVLARDQGESEQAERYLLQGLKLAQRFPDLESDLLLHLSFIELNRQSYAKAEENMQKGLELARQIESQDRIAALLHAQGLLARIRGDYASAEAFLQDGLALAREVGRRWYIGIILVEQGEVYLRERKPEAANAAFLGALQTAQQTAKESDILFITGLALSGLGRVAELRGNFAEAQQRGQQSLTILESIGHTEAARVKAWLAGLPSSEAP